MKKYIFFTVFVLTFIFSRPVFADTVTQFVFVTTPQTIGVDVSSETITIQSQNSSGLPEDITETNDVVFTSTSATGQFLSTSGNPVTTTMSKNTANKNFLYKDITSGSHTLTITATGRTSLSTFTASQQIVVGGEVNTTNNTSNATTSQNTTTTTNTPEAQPVQTVSSSAHSSPSPLSNTENKMEFEVSAGRDRLTTVGNSIVFIASPTKLQNISKQSISYTWSFGDGTTGKGETVSHYFRHAGDYAVVLNAFSSDKQAVSRLNVRVVSPKISIRKIDEGVEIENKSGAEINLGNWILNGNNKLFALPEDTLIPAGKKTIFPDDVTGINTLELKLVNPTNKTVAVSNPLSSKSESSAVVSSQFNLGEIQAKIDEAKSVLARVYSQKITAPPVVPVILPVTESIPVPPIEITKLFQEPELFEKTEDQLANAIQVFVAPKNRGLVNSIFSWPIKGFSFIKHIFIED